jgi:hypothetical protein
MSDPPMPRCEVSGEKDVIEDRLLEFELRYESGVQ